MSNYSCVILSRQVKDLLVYPRHRIRDRCCMPKGALLSMTEYGFGMTKEN